MTSGRANKAKARPIVGMAPASWSVTLLLIGFALILVAPTGQALAVIGWACVIFGLLIATIAVLFDGNQTWGRGRAD